MEVLASYASALAAEMCPCCGGMPCTEPEVDEDGDLDHPDDIVDHLLDATEGIDALHDVSHDDEEPEER